MNTKLWTDPIVDEIHAIREEMAREAGYDLDVIVQELKAMEMEHRERFSSREPVKANRQEER